MLPRCVHAASGPSALPLRAATPHWYLSAWWTYCVQFEAGISGPRAALPAPATTRIHESMNRNNLLWVAGLLLVLWVVAAVTKFVVGALLHLLWIAALVLLVMWAYRKIF